MEINTKLASLARHMNRMAASDMADLSKDEADLFHTACDAINQLMESRERKEDNEALDDFNYVGSRHHY
jgi:hypothetical protein